MCTSLQLPNKNISDHASLILQRWQFNIENYKNDQKSLSLVQREPKNSNCQDIKMIRYTQQRQITFLAILGMKAQLQNHKCNPIALFKFQFENTSEWLCLTTRVLSIHNDVKQGKTKYADSRKLQCLVVGLPLCCSLLYVMNQILCVKMI